MSDTERPSPDNRQWIREVLKLEPAGALACSGIKSRKAFEFPTDKALKDYLRQHPDADRKHHWVKQQKSHTPAPAPTTQHTPAVEKKFGAHKVFDAQHPLGKEENHFRAIIGNPDPHNPWQTKDKDAIRSYLSKKLGQKPKYDDLRREIQQRQKAAEVISYGFWSATKHVKDPTFKLDMVTNRRGVPQGMVTSYETPENELEIGALASSGQVRGMGTYLIAKTIKEHLKEGERLTLSALDTAKPFYRKIGMKAVDPIGPMFYFEHDDAMKFADKVYGELGTRKTASVADLKDLAIVQLQDGNWNYDEYMHGMANGMILSLHTVNDLPGSPNFLTRPEKYLADEVVKVAKDLLAVSELPNDVMENGYPQEYMSPSPAEVGSVRPGDDKLLTGKVAAKEKKHYRFDPGHRRKPGPGWSETESGWTKPRPTQLQQSPTPTYEPSGVQPQHSFVGRRFRGSF